MLYLDYLLPKGISQEKFKLSKDVIDYCNGRVVKGSFYDVDLKIYSYIKGSDHFDLDHQDYYLRYISNFKLGIHREGKSILNIVYKDDVREFTEDLRESAYTALANVFASLPFIRLLKATNAKVESITYFLDNFSWEDAIAYSDCELDNFFSTEFRFECDDFEALCKLLSTFPISAEQYFELRQHHIFLPNQGYAEDETALYILKIRVHPNLIKSKLGIRKHLNQYMTEIKNNIVDFQNNN